MSIELTVLCTVLGAVVGYLGYRRVSNHDIEENAKNSAYLTSKLEYISKGVDDIRIDMKTQDRRITELSDKVARLEESTKSAHHRIGEIMKERS